jgi:hypothetical protein
MYTRNVGRWPVARSSVTLASRAKITRSAGLLPGAVPCICPVVMPRDAANPGNAMRSEPAGNRPGVVR